MPLLLKLETKSSPVRGISFHHKRPWVLTSLENGIIQLWDYRISKILREYKGHDGAVRGICFHGYEPIFVSGGDDKLLKVWNFYDKECVSVLSGHTGIIRSCSFHYSWPWILSASNDNTIRIWNWNFKKCIATLIGHKMAVTCAMFKLNTGFIVSTSTDGTINLWDVCRLANIQNQTLMEMGLGLEDPFFLPIQIYKSNSSDPNTNGFNCFGFTTNFRYFVAGADDHTITMLKYERNNEFTVIDRYEGHDSIYSIALHPIDDIFFGDNNLDVIIFGCSNDNSIKTWSALKKECIDICRYHNERFGVLAAHESLCLFAAGHENGMILFKNKRERPVFCVKDGFVYYMKNDSSYLRNPKKLRELNVKTKDDVFVHDLCPDDYLKPSTSLSFNPSVDAFIVTRRTHDRKDCDYEFYKLHSKSDGKRNYHRVEGSGRRAFWITCKEFAVLNESRKVELRDLSNAITCELDIIADDIFYAGIGMILLKMEDEYKLYDIEKKKVTATVKLQDEIRYVIWSELNEYAAFLAKKKLFLLNRKLEILCIREESNNLKSGCWIDESVFVYNTRYHVKYALTSGDSGLIKTLDKQLYIFAATGLTLCCFDKKANIIEVPIESFEYKLKLALFHGRPDEALRLLKSEHAKFVCQSMIEVLLKYGYSDIALNFEKDDRARFLLALECGNLEKAMEAAERLDEYDAWKTLAEAALLHGNHKIAEICYLKTNNYEKLSFLYFVTGNTEKVRDLMKVIDDPNVQFQITLLIGDVGERIRILKRCDQLSLAYLAAATHGYENEVDELKIQLEFKKRPLPMIYIDPNPRFLAPPRPVHRLMENWPVVEFAGSLDDPGLGGSITRGAKSR